MHRHLGSKEDDGDEDKKVTKKITEKRDEIQVIAQQDLTQRRFVADEIIHLFREVEHHGYQHDETQGQEEGAQKLPDYIDVEFLQHGL